MSSSAPVRVMTSSGSKYSITFSTSNSGVDAPEVIPKLELFSSHFEFMSSGPLTR